MKTKLFFLTIILSTALYSQPKSWRYVNAVNSVFESLPGNQNTLFTGDVAGLIKRSTNNGQAWEIVYRGDATAINDLKFIDAQIGFATCLDQGLFLKTVDGGQTWEQNILLDSTGQVTSERLYTVVLLDTSTFILNGTRHTASSAFISQDKGQSFKQIGVPGTVHHVSGDTLLATGQSGFSFGIYLSTDLGESWNLVKSLPSGLYGNNFYYNGVGQISIINSKKFFISSNDLHPDDVFYTSDGGISFSSLTEPVNNFHPQYVHFTSTTHGVIGGEISSKYGLFSTTDGGQNWTPLFSSQTTQLQENIYPPIKNLGNNVLMANRFNHAVISTDGGLTFTNLSDDFGLLGNYSGMSIKPVNNNYAYALASTGFGTNYQVKFSYTQDGGMNWNNMVDNSNAAIVTGTKTYCPISKDTIFYVQGKNIMRYVRGSSISTQIVSQYTVFSVNGIVDFKKRNHSLLALGKDYLHFSKDNGATWTNYSHSIPGNTVIDFDYKNLNAIYVLTESDLFLSTDTGATFTSIKQNMNLSGGGTNSNNGIYCITNNQIILYGNSGRLYKTTDGGQNWVDYNSNLPQNPPLDYYHFRWMSFKNDTIGYTGNSTANGGYYVLQTTDGGEHWSVFNNGQYMVTPIDMNFADTATGYLIGASGPNILRYFSDVNTTTDTVMANNNGGGSNVSFEELTSLKTFVYPNPTQGICKLNGPMALSVTCYDLQGKNLNIAAVNNNTINLTHLQPGVYLLVITDVFQNTTYHKIKIE